jgi:hypothetical protein
MCCRLISDHFLYTTAPVTIATMTQVENRIVQEVIYQNEAFLRRHLVLSSTVVDKLQDKGVITDVTKRTMMVSMVHYR